MWRYSALLFASFLLIIPLALQASAQDSAPWIIAREPPNLAEGSSGGKITISGTVIDPKAEGEIYKKVIQYFPFQDINRNMTVGPGGVDFQNAKDAISILSNLKDGSISIKPEKCEVNGVALDDVKILTEEIKKSLGSSCAEQSISLKPLTPSNQPFSLKKLNNTIYINGLVPTVDQIFLNKEIAQQFPGAVLIDETTSTQAINNNFSSAAKVAIDQMQNFPQGAVKFDNDNFKITGSVKDSDFDLDSLSNAYATVTKFSLPKTDARNVSVQLSNNVPQDQRTVDVLFATDRAPEKELDGQAQFGSGRSDELNFGAAQVHIPVDHKLGHIELPENWTLFGFVFWKGTTDEDKHFILKATTITSKKQWMELSNSKGSDALIFVHGYNKTFQDSIFQTAQIAWDLQYTGNIISFSWPSRGNMLSYEADRNSALFARGHFIQLLNLLEKDVGLVHVNVLAHSMGNLVVLDALSNYSQTASSPKVEQLIMAAPDIDRDGYKQCIPNINSIAKGMTLYASSADKALMLSRTLAQGPRAGDVINGAPIIVKGVDAIDVTAVGDDILGLDHDTFSAKRPLIDDINLVLQGQRPPNKRMSEIRGMPAGAQQAEFWRYAQ